jgi:glucose/arabinose dehydrogenase
MKHPLFALAVLLAAAFAQAQSLPLEKIRLPAGVEFRLPELELPAHVAALGMRFYTGTQFPEEYRVAEYRSFAQGWLQGERAWDRPADVEVEPEGALYVSDDEAGAVYRIRYSR